MSKALTSGWGKRSNSAKQERIFPNRLSQPSLINLRFSGFSCGYRHGPTGTIVAILNTRKGCHSKRNGHSKH